MDELDDVLKRNNIFFRQLLFLAVLIVMGVVMLQELSFVLGSFLGAITIYIVLRPLQHSLVERYSWRPWIASLILVTGASLLLVGLLFGLLRVVASELTNVDVKAIISGFDDVVDLLNDKLPFDVIPPTYLSDAVSYITKGVGSVINTTYSFLINILFTIIILYFMLANSRKLERKIGRYNPFSGENRDMVMGEISNIIYSNAVGIPIIMLGQGLAAALIYWIFGIQHVAFWAFLTAIAGLIPIVGSVIISAPLGIFIIVNGSFWHGMLLILCGILVIANADNLVRIFLNKWMTDTHPLIVIFGVFMGIPLFGFWGIIFGPLLISLFILLIKIYYREFKLMTPQDMEEERLEEMASKQPKKRVGWFARRTKK